MQPRKELLLDSNLLLLLIVGVMDPDTIPRFKRTSKFSSEQFEALLDFVSNATNVITTPHILTEVSNLANALREDQKTAFVAAFRAVIETLDERWQPAKMLSTHRLFRFGLADTASATASTGAVLVTEDGRFASQVNALGGYALSLEAALAFRKQEA